MFSAYCVGLPLAYLFGISLGLGVVGLWAGLSGGPLCNCLMQSYIRARTDWEQQARAAQERSRKKKARLQAAAAAMFEGANAAVQAVADSDDQSASESESLIASDAKAAGETAAAEEGISPARP